jgi:hypothetical protein
LRWSTVVAMLLGAVASTGPAGAAQPPRTLTATPSTDLTDGTQLVIEGSGFTPMSVVGVCQGILDDDPGVENCGVGFGIFFADENGEFATSRSVERFIVAGGREQTVDCAAPAETCGLISSELNDLDGTVATTPLAFRSAPPISPPDAIVENIATGAYFGDDFYTTYAGNQTKSRKVPVGTTWSWALRVQNDRQASDDLTVFANPQPGVRFFIGYYDVTTEITQDGLRLDDMSPGAIVKIPVQMRTERTPVGQTKRVDITVRSASIPALRDDIRLQLLVVAAP